MEKFKKGLTKIKDIFNRSQKQSRDSKMRNIKSGKITNSSALYPKSSISAPQMLTAGNILKARRKELNLSIKKIANDTKIQEAYLEKLENNDFESFDSLVFVNGYVKIYADYLGLDVDKLSALFRRQTKQESTTVKVRTNRNKTGINTLSKLITPNNVLIGMGITFVLAVILFISIQFYNFRKAPMLEIYTPANQTISQEKKVEISGTTENSVSVFINDNEINVDENNNFTTEINLREGTNTITIKASKTNSQQSSTTKVLTINYEPAQAKIAEPDAIDVKQKEFTVKLQTLTSEAWIMLSVDNKQELAQIVAANQIKEFPLTESLTLSTGRPSVTKLYINDEEININIDASTGVAQVSCTIKNSDYICN